MKDNIQCLLLSECEKYSAKDSYNTTKSPSTPKSKSDKYTLSCECEKYSAKDSKTTTQSSSTHKSKSKNVLCHLNVKILLRKILKI